VQLPWYGNGDSECRDLRLLESHEAEGLFLVKERQMWAFKGKLLRKKRNKKIKDYRIR
jgi:hypothetical protein